MDPNKLKQFREAAIKAGYKSVDFDKFLSQKQQELATMELVKGGQLDFKSFAQSSPVLANKLIQQGFQPQTSKDPEEVYADLKATQGIEELSNPNLNNETQSFAQGIESGAFGWEQVPQDQRAKVINYFSQQGKTIPKEQSVEEKGKITSGSSTLNFINSLEQFYQGAKGGQFAGPVGRVLGKAKSIKGGIGLDPNAKVYEDAKSGFAATLKQLTGDTGVLTDQDYARLAKLLPELGSTPEEAQKKFNQLRSQIGSTFGVEGESTAIKDESQTDSAILELLGMVAPQTKKTIQNIGQSYEQPTLKQFVLGNPIAGPLGQILGLGTGQQQQASQTGLELAGLLGTGQLAKGLITGTGKKLGLSATNKQSVELGRKTAIAAADKAGIKYSGKNLAKAGEDFVLNNPEYKSVGKEILPTLKKRTLTNKDLVKQISDWSKGTYTKAGDVRSAQLSQFRSILADAARAQLRDNAPEVAKYQELFSKIYGKEKFVKRIASSIPYVATAAGTGAIFSRLFGGR